jgi:hypothetical protein
VNRRREISILGQSGNPLDISHSSQKRKGLHAQMSGTIHEEVQIEVLDVVASDDVRVNLANKISPSLQNVMTYD